VHCKQQNSLRTNFPVFRTAYTDEFPDIWQNFLRKFALFDKPKMTFLVAKSPGT